MSEKVTVFEVGPRDGLQNEPWSISLLTKKWFISGLLEAGVEQIEVGSFVRGDRVPQMADTDRIAAAARSGELRFGKKARGWYLVPNLKGLERAIEAGVKNIAVFTAASETFNRRNIGMSIEESLRTYQQVIHEARKHRLRVRGYVSTVFGCPYEGRVSPKQALKVISKLHELGAEQVSVGDTIGVATPKQVDEIVRPAFKSLGQRALAVHFHDTRGTALANSLRALEHGVRTIDSSAGGLGGCPFAPGATGNLATEDLVYLLEGMGLKTGINLERLARTSMLFSKKIHKQISSRYVLAYRSSLLRKKR
jgi:hydroxymethylglutaryl-CoA lyase